MTSSYIGFSVALAIVAAAGASAQDGTSPTGTVPTGTSPEPAPPAEAPPPPTAQDSVTDLKTMISEGRYVEATAKAKEALATWPNDFELNYYDGMANMGLRNYDAAYLAAERAKTLAPEASRGAVDKLVETINSFRQSSSAAAEAEQALADGLIAKAARLYDQLWQQDRNNAQYAFKAIDLYANGLLQWADVGRLLNDVVKSMPESPESRQAKTDITKFSKQLTDARDALMATAEGQSWPEAKPALDGALAIDPQNAAIDVIRVIKASKARDGAEVRATIARLAKRGPIDVKLLGMVSGIGDIAGEPVFQQFMTDVIGQSQYDKFYASIVPGDYDTIYTELALKKQLHYWQKTYDPTYNVSYGLTAQSADGVYDSGCTLRFPVKKYLSSSYSDKPNQFSLNFKGLESINVSTYTDNFFKPPQVVNITLAWRGQDKNKSFGLILPDMASARKIAKSIYNRATMCNYTSLVAVNFI